jgi:hypothetical protein
MSAYAGNPAAATLNGRLPGQSAPAPADAVPSQRSTTGSQSIDALVRHLESVQFDSASDVAAFCEALRALGHRLGTETAMAGHELSQVMKAEAKNRGKLGIPNFDMQRAGRSVAKKLTAAAGSFADAAGSAVAAWHTFEKEFEPLMNGSKAKTRKEFKFDA